jgi:alpha-glucosidase (family GH31 glycosyl hydrolase)
VQKPNHYVAIVAMMRLREQLREYASQANASLHVSIAHAHTLTFFCHSRQEPDHYEGIVAMMRLREQLREYVSQANAVHAATGLPILRPMFIQYPLDPECQTAQVRSPVKRSY